MKRINVCLRERSYPIYVSGGSLDRLGEMIVRHGLKGTACVVSQNEVWSRWGAAVKSGLDRSGVEFKLHIPSSRLKSEQMKSSAELLRLIAACSALDGSGRGVFLIALGGGVIGDLTGFAASIYRRGIPYAQVPTTLTAQVDSAIGGKTAVDLPHGKNLLGTIYQPRFVLSDPRVLKTLPLRNFCEGLAEVVKYGVIKDAVLFKFLEAHKSDVLSGSAVHLERMILACARIKAAVVSRDEWDKKDVRIVLNFGHTVGHAIESASGYSGYSHGEAVSIGMMCALELSQALGVLKDRALPARLERLLRDFNLPVRIDSAIQIDRVMRAIGYDKKNIDGTNRFVLVERIGRTRVHPAVPQRLIQEKLFQRQQGRPERTSSSGLWRFFSGKKKDGSKSVRAEPVAIAPTKPTSPPRKHLVGEVEGYYDKAGVAIIRLLKPVKLGDKLRIFGNSTDMTLRADSMQVNRRPIESASKGKVIGLKVAFVVRRGDGVYSAASV